MASARTKSACLAVAFALGACSRTPAQPAREALLEDAGPELDSGLAQCWDELDHLEWAPLPEPLEVPEGDVTFAMRRRHSMVWTGSRVGVWGGRIGDAATNTGFLYDPVARTYQLIPVTEHTPEPRTDFDDTNTGMNPDSGLWLIWGGRQIAVESEEEVNLGHPPLGAIYDVVLNAWYPVATSAANAPPARAYPHVVPRGDRWILFGGNDTDSDDNDFNVGSRVLTTHYYDGAGVRRSLEDDTDDCWSSLDDLPDASELPTSCPSEVEELPATFPIRKHGAVHWLGDRMVVWGGVRAHTTERNDGFIFDYTASTVTAFNSSGAPAGRENMVSAASPDAFYVFGGVEAGFVMVSGGGVYDFSEAEWETLPTVNAPTPRLGRGFWIYDRYFFVPQGFSAVIVGESFDISVTADAALYDSVTGEWIRFEPDHSEYIERFQGNAVWTGDRLVAWGGSVMSGTPPLGAELVLPSCLAGEPE